MSDGFVFPIYETVAILHCTCDPLQCMSFHLGKRDHTICLQQLFGQNKFLRLDSLRILHPHSLRIVNCRDLVLLQISIHSSALDHLLRSSMTTGVCQHNIPIAFFTKDPGKGTYHNRMSDHRLFHLCFFQKVWLQENFFFSIYKASYASKLLQSTFH